MNGRDRKKAAAAARAPKVRITDPSHPEYVPHPEIREMVRRHIRAVLAYPYVGRTLWSDEVGERAAEMLDEGNFAGCEQLAARWDINLMGTQPRRG